MLLRRLRRRCCTFYSLLTAIAKCIDLSLLDYSSYFKDVITQYWRLSIQSLVRLIEVFNNRNEPNTLYFSVRVRLIEASGVRYKGKYIEDITRWREDMNFIFEWQNGE